MKQIRRESRNAYGLVVKMREQESSFIKEIHPLVFANKSDYLDSIVLWLVHNIIIKGWRNNMKAGIILCIALILLGGVFFKSEHFMNVENDAKAYFIGVAVIL